MICAEPPESTQVRKVNKVFPSVAIANFESVERRRKHDSQGGAHVLAH